MLAITLVDKLRALWAKNRPKVRVGQCLIVILVLPVSAAGCERNLTDGIADERALRQAVEEHVLRGTRLDSAELFLEGQGFTCEHIGVIGVDDSPPGSSYRFLRCTKKAGRAVNVVRAWMVELAETGNRVDSILSTSVERAR